MHVLDLAGEVVKSVKPHSASIIDICMDETADFIGTASIDGESAYCNTKRRTLCIGTPLYD